MSRKRRPKVVPQRGYLHTLDVANCSQGIRAEEIAELCGVDITTARRWKSGTSRIPATAAAILLGDLGAFSKAWRGWRVVGDDIISPDQWTISRNDALAVPLLLAQVQALRGRIRELEWCQDLESQPLPGTAGVQIKGT
jgi:transcriptional regulator with XRE-family HTH domain